MRHWGKSRPGYEGARESQATGKHAGSGHPVRVQLNENATGIAQSRTRTGLEAGRHAVTGGRDEGSSNRCTMEAIRAPTGDHFRRLALEGRRKEKANQRDDSEETRFWICSVTGALIRVEMALATLGYAPDGALAEYESEESDDDTDSENVMGSNAESSVETREERARRQVTSRWPGDEALAKQKREAKRLILTEDKRIRQAALKPLATGAMLRTV